MYKPTIRIGDRLVGKGQPVWIVAELSANHHQRYEEAAELVRVAKECGADAVKLQTYTPDTMTISSAASPFTLRGGTPWDGRTLHELYAEAHMPWEWQPMLKALAVELEIALFSTPFDSSAVDFLEELDVPAYKIASFELVDLPLIRRAGATGKPLILSTGMATLAEIDEAVQTARAAGATEIALLRTNSAYPAPPDEMNLRTIPHLARAFGVPVGLSDHTLGFAVPVAAVALEATIIEKHLTLSRAMGGPDSAFSLEPHEFRAMVEAARTAERAIGSVYYGVTDRQKASRALRRSLFVVKDMRAGEMFSEENVRSIRPADGLHTRYLGQVIGRRAVKDVQAGTPLDWNLIG